ncbi:MAG TPA: DUF1569 domain-containing protein [Gemmataceae bacterium]|jgi:hypothetical protein|nr:DUF1569 domain-containing protein [Gemmataceae bacterium]
MSDKPRRRSLVFNNLDEVTHDAEALLAKGYDKAGQWDLAQCANHLADWMRFPVEGFPKPPAPIRAMLWMMRKTIGRKKLLTYLKDKSFPAGKPTMPQTVIAPGGDAKAAVEKLKASVEKLKAFTGTIVPSPLFGAMTKDEAVGMQLVHAAHHLSFLVPKNG